MPSEFEKDNYWRDEAVGIIKRQKYLLDTGFLSDCGFLVGKSEEEQRQFRCHKFILAVASPVFERMFFGELAEKSDPILLPDVTPEAFEILLRYMYIDMCEIPDNLFDRVVDIYYVGQKYMMMDFIKRFTDWLLAFPLKMEHILPIYSFANIIENNDLIKKCTQLCSSNAALLVTHSTFHQLEMFEVHNICKIVKDDITAIQMFDAIGNYALVNGLLECEKIKKESCEVNCNENAASSNHVIKEEGEDGVALSKFDCKLHDLMKLINFDEISARDFAETAAHSKLLDPKESLAILSRLCISQLPG